jgi:hypothetical protein
MQPTVRFVGLSISFTLCFVARGENTGLISFHDLTPSQSITFTVSSTCAARPGVVAFDVEVHSSPTMRALIRLRTQSNIDGWVEKVWGHSAGEPVEKRLSAADVVGLEKLLSDYRANGFQADVSLQSPGWQEFRLRDSAAKTDTVERYKLMKEGDRSFIEQFVGFRCEGLTNRSSQPLAGPLFSFQMTATLNSTAKLAPASGG